MNKVEFVSRLEQLLNDIPQEEREEAIRYYQDYFDDAVDVDEEKLIDGLGSPEQIAHQIKLDLYNKASQQGGIYTETGYSNTFYEQKKDEINVINEQKNENGNNYRQENGNNYRQQYNNSYEMTYKKKSSIPVWLIVLLVCTCPIWGSVLFGLTVAVFATVFGIVIGFGAAFLGLFLGGIICIGVGIAQMFTSVLPGILCIGAGLILLSLSLLFLIVCILIVNVILPSIIDGIRYVFHKFSKKGENQGWEKQSNVY